MFRSFAVKRYGRENWDWRADSGITQLQLHLIINRFVCLVASSIQDPWNIFDLVVVGFSLISLWFSFPGITALRLVRTLRFYSRYSFLLPFRVRVLCHCRIPIPPFSVPRRAVSTRRINNFHLNWVEQICSLHPLSSLYRERYTDSEIRTIQETAAPHHPALAASLSKLLFKHVHTRNHSRHVPIFNMLSTGLSQGVAVVWQACLPSADCHVPECVDHSR